MAALTTQTEKSVPYKQFAYYRNRVFEWENFVLSNTWASSYVFNGQVPEKCISVYHVVENKKIVDRLYTVTWDKKYKTEFKQLSLAGIKEHFPVEKHDIKQLDNPEEIFIKPGGQVFFLLSSSGLVIGAATTVVHGKEIELAKMSVRKGYMNKGYGHLLLQETLRWSIEKKYPYADLLCNTKLQNAISIYKKLGFKTTMLGPHPSYKRCDIGMRIYFDDLKLYNKL